VDAGHAIQLEKPEIVVSAIEEVLAMGRERPSRARSTSRS
jgi:hypothetical protein